MKTAKDLLDTSNEERIVVVVNSVDFSGVLAEQVYGLCKKRFIEDRRDILIQLNKVRYCGSATIEMILKLRWQIKSLGNKLVLEVGEISTFKFFQEIALERVVELNLAAE